MVNSTQKTLLTFAAFIAISNSCSNQSPSPRDKKCAEVKTAQSLTTAVYYDTNVAPIIQSKCLGCHSGQTNPNLSSYELFKSNYNSSINQINSNQMPRGSIPKLTLTEKSTLASWAQGGYLQSATTPSNPPSPTPNSPTTQITYNTDIKPMMNSYCVSCHTNTPPLLTDYQSVKNSSSQIYNAIYSGSMPRGSSRLGTTEVSKFKTWIDQGMLENGSNTTPTSTTTPSNPQNSSDDATGC